ncbi:methyl-accepting chemotaxis protein [Silvimonas terrae]|uniref:Methyl-accepting chemotaxis protein n=1 Tax=Silvimonas terrae TaxID=300266 RepID=A0A840RH66_9NEIS|nr:methyl-accepting chemotaxis protein [Silvimonas terrae]MBB5191666.1 methyl-accepting chemotaxis protein [Silvimonas terrae]
MKISTRIAALLTLAVLGLVIISACSFIAFSRLKNNVYDIAENTVPSETLIFKIQAAVGRARLMAVQRLYFDGDQSQRDQLLTQQLANIDALFKKYKDDGMISDAKDQAGMDENLAMYRQWSDLARKYAIGVDAAHIEESRKVFQTQAAPLAEKMSGALDNWTAYNDSLGVAAKDAAYSTINSSRLILSSISLIAIVAMLGIGIWLYRGITSQITGLQDLVTGIAQSLDFTRRSHSSSQDEIGRTASAINHLLGTVEDSMQKILSATGEVSSMASTMSGAANAVATSSVLQSDAASNMAAAVQEVTVSINHVSEQARQAADASSRSGELASEGERVIGQTTSDMRNIQRTIEAAAGKVGEVQNSSQQVDSVLQVIKEVADQTNLLALNAAIEAARAGDAGRGFAVVADEVRKLAERTASSAIEIRTIVQQMQATSHDANSQMVNAVEIARGAVDRAAQAENSISTIRQSSSAAVELVGQITNAIAEQSAASNVIANQVESVAQMTEHNSESAQSTARSADALQQIVTRLTSEIGRYRLAA